MPDIVVEILSPGNVKKQLVNKFEVYEDAGVKEYRSVSSLQKIFFRYVLDNAGNFEPSKLLTTGEEVTTLILPGFSLSLDYVFRD